LMIRSNSARDIVTEWKTRKEALVDFMRALQHPFTGVKIGFHDYQADTFRGSKFVSWTRKYLKISTAEVVELGGHLVEQNMIEFVKGSAGPGFHNNNSSLYRIGRDYNIAILPKSSGSALIVPEDIIAAMVDPTAGVEVKDRRSFLKTFRNCFLGSDAVSWISNHLNVTREDALVIGRKLHALQYFRHVTNERDLKDDNGMYFFRMSALNLAKAGMQAQARINASQELVISDTIDVDNSELMQDINAVHNLQKVLVDVRGRELLRKYMESQHCAENLDFWYAIQVFRWKSKNQPQEFDALREAKSLVQQFIGVSSLIQVNIDSKVEKQIIEEVNQEEIYPEMFDNAQLAVYDLIIFGAWTKFEQSPQCQQFLSQA